MFGAVKLTENADIDNYKYSGYGVGFDGKGTFSFPSGRFGPNAILSGVGMSSSVHVNNKRNDILILGEGGTQGLNGRILTAEKYIQLVLKSLCDKPSNLREYLDYENCKCRKKSVNNLVEECSENLDENEVITVTFLLLAIDFLIIIGISSILIYFHLVLKEE